MTEDTKELYTASEVATYFRVDRRTVVRWAKAGKIEALRTIGGHFRIPAHAVKKLRNDQQEG
jgi:excisionase family DNA binding protein